MLISYWDICLCSGVLIGPGSLVHIFPLGFPVTSPQNKLQLCRINFINKFWKGLILNENKKLWKSYRFDGSLIRLQKHSCSCLHTGISENCAKIHTVLVVTTSFSFKPIFLFCILQDQRISRCQGAPCFLKCNYKLRFVYLHPIKSQ